MEDKRDKATLDRNGPPDQLWPRTLAQYRAQPSQQQGRAVLELAMPALVGQMDSLAEIPADVDIDDVWHQLTAEFLEIAVASGYPAATPRALAFRAGRRVRFWLHSQIADPEST
jgi:hypothetical protein